MTCYPSLSYILLTISENTVPCLGTKAELENIKLSHKHLLFQSMLNKGTVKIEKSIILLQIFHLIVRKLRL